MKNYDEAQLENCLARVQDAKEQLEIVKQVLVDFGSEWEDVLLQKTSIKSKDYCAFLAVILDTMEAHIEIDIENAT